MSDVDPVGESSWFDASLAAALFLVDPVGTGVALRAAAGPVRDQWLSLVRDGLPAATPWRRLPIHVTDARLLGGLDLTATLNAGKPVVEAGVLAEADAGVLLIAMAERVSSSAAARITAVMDAGEVLRERDGFASRSDARFGVVALDEGADADERPPEGLIDRLAFHLDLDGIGLRDTISSFPDTADFAKARERFASVEVPDVAVTALCAAALALGVSSLRASVQAVRVAKAHAALEGRAIVGDADAAVAARLVLAPRATQWPPPDQRDDDASSAPEERDEDAGANRDGGESTKTVDASDEIVLDAAKAAIPPGILAQLLNGGRLRVRAGKSGKSGALQRTARRGRAVGVRPGTPRSGATLHIVETLRAAAPWQRLRRSVGGSASAARIEVRSEDFRVMRYKHRTETTTIFVVDASGSSALNRLAEAKGAVELLLADCYARRDRVALIAFRGATAELLLPPTRSLVRAKRRLAGLPGGGGTPLASGIDAAVELAVTVRRSGRTPIAVLLTDGKANVGRDGIGGRARAEEEALAAARSARESHLTCLLVDTSPQPQPQAVRLAEEMGANYLALPYADSGALSRAVRDRSADLRLAR